MCTYFVQMGEVPEDGEDAEMADSKTKRRRSFSGKNRFRWAIVQLACTESSQAESEKKVPNFCVSTKLSEEVLCRRKVAQ